MRNLGAWGALLVIFVGSFYMGKARTYQNSVNLNIQKEISKKDKRSAENKRSYKKRKEYLVKDLIILGIWNDEMKDKIVLNDGSIQNIKGIPEIIRERYRTAWEIKQKHILDMAIDRGAFICQSQSLNLFVESPNFKRLSSMHFYGWENGLKTGMYYLRSRPSSKALQFTLEPEKPCESCSG